MSERVAGRAREHGHHERERVGIPDERGVGAVALQLALGEQAHGVHEVAEAHRHRHRHRESDEQGDQGTPREARRLAHQGRADPGERAELRADRHGAHDQDRVVEHDTARRDRRRDDQERHVRDRERGLLVRGVGQLLPQDRVRALARGVLLGPVGAQGQRQVDVLDGDRARPVDAQLPQPADEFVTGLARDVAHDDVARRIAGGVREDHDVRGPGRLLDQTHHVVRGVGRRDEAQMQHGGLSSSYGCNSYSLRRRRRWTLWSGPLRMTSPARPRVGATFSRRLTLLMVRQVLRA